MIGLRDSAASALVSGNFATTATSANAISDIKQKRHALRHILE